MMQLLNDYFSYVTHFPVDEKEIAKRVKQAFKINSVYDLWKLKAAIRYSKDDRLGENQIMQDLGTSMYYLSGDCEDIARAQVVVGKLLGKPISYLFLFPDFSYQGGHVCVIGQDGENRLYLLNYTTYIIGKDPVPYDTDDVRFREQLNALIFTLSSQKWAVVWVVNTDENEIPTSYSEIAYKPNASETDIVTYPDTPLIVSDYLDALSLTYTLAGDSVILIVGLTLLFGAILGR